MTPRAIAEELAAIRAHVARIEQFIITQTVVRPTRKQQAKKLGVHPNTLRNREKRAALRILVNGGL